MTRYQLRAGLPRHDQAKRGLRAVAWSTLLLSLLLIVAACGDDDGDAATEAPVQATSAADADEPTAADADEATAADADEATDAEADEPTAADADEPTDAEADEPTAADADEATAVDADEPTDADADEVPDSLADLASDSGSATVTIGDETFEFTLAGTSTIDGSTHVGRCKSLFGMVTGNGFATDGRDITLDIEIPPVDWETYEDDRFDGPDVEVEDNVANASWVADQANEFVSGSGVGEYEQEGETASGTAMFVNQWAPDSEPVEGTFEIDCGS